MVGEVPIIPGTRVGMSPGTPDGTAPGISDGTVLGLMVGAVGITAHGILLIGLIGTTGDGITGITLGTDIMVGTTGMVTMLLPTGDIVPQDLAMPRAESAIGVTVLVLQATATDAAASVWTLAAAMALQPVAPMAIAVRESEQPVAVADMPHHVAAIWVRAALLA